MNDYNASLMTYLLDMYMDRKYLSASWDTVQLAYMLYRMLPSHGTKTSLCQYCGICHTGMLPHMDKDPPRGDTENNITTEYQWKMWSKIRD